MRAGAWETVLSRYGQRVTVRTGEEERPVRAFVQEAEEDEELVPSPLGMRREERAVYFGPVGVPLLPRESEVEWKGRRYQVRGVREVGDGHHLQAILVREEDEA